MTTTISLRGGWLGWLIVPLLLSLYVAPAAAQNAAPETECNPTEGLPVATGEVFLNYGAVTNSFSLQSRSSYSLGQPIVTRMLGQRNLSEGGYWSRFLLPPQAPVVRATQGDFGDRIQISWNLDPLSATATRGYILTRDGNFLAELEPGTSNFIDFNVQPGEFYEYNVQGRNGFGTGSGGISVGFTNPNGVVSGRVTSRQGNPIFGTTVTLEPSIGRALSFDGDQDYVCLSHDARLDLETFTFSAYIRPDAADQGGMIIDRGHDLNRNFWVQANAGGGSAGVTIGLGSTAGSEEVNIPFPGVGVGEWVHLALVYDAGTLLVYVDGNFAGSTQAAIDYEPALFTLGRDRAGNNSFTGLIDDVRFYDRYLTQTEIMLTKDISASRSSAGLVAYWKFDEGIGEKVFDTGGGDIDGTLFGNTTFTSQAAPVKNGAFTDEGGYYSIDGVNYSGQETFTVSPSQNFYDHTSLEFNATRSSEVRLPEIAWSDSATLEITVRPFVADGLQTIASTQSGDFTLSTLDGTLQLQTPNGGTQQLGALPQDRFNHLAFVFDGPNQTIAWFLNGTRMGQVPGRVATGTPATAWTIGNHATEADQYFTGLIGEFALFDTLVSVAQLQLHASPLIGDNIVSGIDAGDGNLVAYFPFDEANGNVVEDYGPSALGSGTVTAATFSINDYRQRATPHEYRPSQRVINLNGSNTAVGNVDFTDESTIPVSGVVRFSNTFCYQDSVQILANGLPLSPPVFTDAQGRWSTELEPGASVTLTANFPDTTGDHTFTPTFFETRNITRPIAGVLFQNTTKRRVIGQVAGGACRKSINDPGLPIKVKLQSLNGCYAVTQEVENLAGEFVFTGVPPIPVTVSIDQILPAYERLKDDGGQQTDLRQAASDTIDFIYYAPPNVEISDFPERECGLKYIESSYDENLNKRYTNRIRVYEQYLYDRCYLRDSLQLRIDNQIADAVPFDTIVRDTDVFVLRYPAGIPNFVGNNLKRLVVTATNVTGNASNELGVVVTGRKPREGTFTTVDPQYPLFVLRAPPGDQSSATLEAGTTICSSNNSGNVFINENTGTKVIDASPTNIINTGAPGVTTEFAVEGGVDTKLKIVQKTNSQRTSTNETCTTFLRTVSTANGENVPHSEGLGDVYVGIAANINITNNDYLYVDTSQCRFRDDSTRITFNLDSYDTEYFYSEWQLITDVIPQLRTPPNPMNAEVFERNLESADKWEEIIANNKYDKESGRLLKNYTFDGLVSIEESLSTSEVYSFSHNTDITATAEFALFSGIEINDAGTKIGLETNIGGGFNFGGGNSTDSTSTISFVLADDDPNDNFTVDILEGGTYPAPIFKLRSGESMCPWEPGTRNREEVGFNVDRNTALNVPETQPAVFKLQLTNEGQTGADQLVYSVGVVDGSNPFGATIRLDGTTLNTRPRDFQIGPDETIELTLTIDRGPEEYNYDSIGIFMASSCMFDHSEALGYDLSNVADPAIYADHPNRDIPREGPYARTDLNKFYKEYRLNVQFLEPCTPIDINFPRQDWVVTPDDNARQAITVVDYDYDDPDLDTVRIQYRITGGDGNWINIAELPADTFLNNPVFYTQIWDMEELRDGPYEIRATATCKDLNLTPGISSVIQGRKETQAPRPLGTPEPADGVLNPGDEISISWTKRINCGLIFPADGIGADISINNLALIDKTTGELIDATISCREDKIIIVPNVPRRFIENHTLGVVANDFQDLYGNESDSIHWEFFVNQSNLYWDGGRIDETVLEGNKLVVTRQIRNQSGEVTDYQIPDVPAWMQVFPRTGSLGPGDRQSVTFEFPADLLADAYSDTLNMVTVDGEEPLIVDLRVTCEGPDWKINPNDFSFSHSLTVELDIEGVLSDDRVDLVGAFVNGELRGVANIRRFDEISGSSLVNPNLAFLTVYSNVSSGETIDFQIWDASACLLYGKTIERIPFVADGVEGKPLAPLTIHTTGELLRKIYFNPGWNWFSYNLDLPDNSVNGTLASLSGAAAGATLKGQGTFAIYSEQANLWFGNLTATDVTTMYQYRSPVKDSLTLIGTAVDVDQPIPIQSGWNWIGYLPNRGLPVGTALSSLEPVNGDIIKNQLTFSQYVAGVGWVGNLNFMSSPNGYLLRLSNAGTLRYPDPEANSSNGLSTSEELSPFAAGELHIDTEARQKSLDSIPAHWSVNPANYEISMNMVAVVAEGADNLLLEEGDEIAAFVDGEIRGADRVLYVPQLERYLAFLTVFAAEPGETVTYRFYDRSEDREVPLTETTSFVTNDVIGLVSKPFVFNLGTTSVRGGDLELDRNIFVYPNPARTVANISFSTQIGDAFVLTIRDIVGRELYRHTSEATVRENVIQWDTDDVPDGIYFITLEHGKALRSAKVQVKR
ncbi:LamG-like jellyroll fold domain-containing protein [Lewinella sp. 4G2]|uniref:LamG-like jellyroll fold domain-containing protein n=1 Tax=Lewinella sp. 4G2 TaxID=1803372 RepID=UPI0007B48B30|nr:LamG-like jellyroll fold domain-containing protein [Lewinella sp. 4G2]OAV45701.1 hypothetical protein A3850_014905 [Lewinella sp. 4G2]